ncbi:cytochrome c peroxidase, partial [Singulisphaera rosea]
EPVKTVALRTGPIVRTPAQRGEASFRDGRRSLDRWMSCASCHTAGHTNGLNFDTQGDGGTGAAKNTPSLLGVGQTAPYTWTGSFSKLGDQIHQSIITSLRGSRVEDSVVEDLSEYLETLSPAPAPPKRDGAATGRGEAVFRARRCDTCHKPPFYTVDGVRDVGLDDGVGGHQRFNPPSLRGVRWSAPYFHDGRAVSLDQVLGIHPPDSIDRPWSSTDREDLIQFLESL